MTLNSQAPNVEIDRFHQSSLALDLLTGSQTTPAINMTDCMYILWLSLKHLAGFRYSPPQTVVVDFKVISVLES